MNVKVYETGIQPNTEKATLGPAAGHCTLKIAN
jgi:hypothetical protein